MKQVLIATPLYPPDIGGPATYTTLLEEQLPQHGWEVIVVSFGESRHLPKVLRHLHFAYHVWKRAKNVSIILAQDPVSVGLPTLFAARLRRKSFMIRMPGDYAWEQSVQRFGVTDTIDDFQHTTYHWRVEWLRSLQQFVAKRAQVVIAPSQYFQSIVKAWGVAPERIRVVYNGIDVNEAPAEIEKPSVPTMVTAGRLVPWKGISGLISVLKKLPDWHLQVLGDGPERDRLEQWATECGVINRVQFSGSVPRSKVLGWCQTADAFVLNTHFESFSFQMVEAMSMRARIITTNIGSLPELITDGEEGVLLAPDDIDGMCSALESVRTEPALWQRRADAAVTKASRFSVANTATGVAKLLAEIQHD